MTTRTLSLLALFAMPSLVFAQGTKPKPKPVQKPAPQTGIPFPIV